MQPVSALMPRVSLSRRVLVLVIALCLLCSAGGPAAVAAQGEPTGCTAPGYAPDICGEDDQGSADKLLHSEIDRLSGTPDVAVTRAARVWGAAASASQGATDSAWWLRCPAHDPPETIRFCRFLI